MYLASEPLTGQVHSLRVVCTASDQGWGNTGHSRVEVALMRGGETVRHYPLKCVTHDMEEQELECCAAPAEEDDPEMEPVMPRSVSRFFRDPEAFCIDMYHWSIESSFALLHALKVITAWPMQLCTEAQPGDTYAVVLVSAPYPGFECQMSAATIAAMVYC